MPEAIIFVVAHLERSPGRQAQVWPSGSLCADEELAWALVRPKPATVSTALIIYSVAFIGHQLYVRPVLSARGLMSLWH